MINFCIELLTTAAYMRCLVILSLLENATKLYEKIWMNIT